MGKPTGNDIQEKKLTLPLIYTLNNTDPATRRKLIYIIKNENRNKKKVQYVLDAVQQHNGIAYAQGVMQTYKQEALDLLHTFPESPIRDGFADLVNYVTDRRY